ncbi:hypothetical protein [Nakamurella sp. PAMC28650]|uniref:hypothetical protein n=1 Tax=Nakamurella sp. PAMC28650 TaxID=2762325 RepID=UPI00164E82E8|nr:hypothetical protein [Nakamurella sp. PAMC28650]QNK81783.1 hypothetical protein H7F38_02975 [Nakamurella sp. PAMC28650]
MDARARRERRIWIREHHPDRGGDPVTFAEGLARGTRGARPSVRRTRGVRRTWKRLRRKIRTLLLRTGRRHRRSGGRVL